MERKNIVILGAGYGGLMTATRLQKNINPKEVKITLINKESTHYETTWLHEASAGSITPEKATYSIQDVLDPKKVDFIEDTVVRIDSSNKTVVTKTDNIPYDYLVVALGFESQTFGIPGLEENALAITNIHSASKIKKELEEKVKSWENKKEDNLTIVVGGGGFTGIELLGELVNELPKLCKAYSVDPAKIKLICVEAAPTILPMFEPKLVSYAISQLEKKGVTFKLGTAIKEATPAGIRIATGEVEQFIETELVIWAAGVKGNRIFADSEIPHERNNKIAVDPYLRIPSHEDIFVVGDCSFILDEESKRPLPPTAQIAMQQGVVCAKNLISLTKGNTNLTPFIYHDKGTVCSLGHKDGIGIVFGKKIKGRTASIMKKVVDDRALFLIGGLPILLKKGKFKF